MPSPTRRSNNVRENETSRGASVLSNVSFDYGVMRDAMRSCLSAVKFRSVWVIVRTDAGGPTLPRLDRLPPKSRAVLRAQPVAEYDTTPDAGPVRLAGARVALVT